ncbi:sugar ABC transporter substrate-binding protein [Bariatricus massiliensis]|uniref:Sugar ABC transporter substrate-binding protein n=1 Tax=Bariatricus massiliensis TaxID=1745713 RepID=A0ABS8DIL4_9FIRM|nr:sugar ABC transporter substrate-binding protein [Bariatricus massiliensis]MCB7304483.1 sugar ABC transporter substrate-binding protein [Bariatricus massiliensis]MCB7375135.1 sugar ABC transporter substrate-binding protein [Bariatricus massiliensis]MCB7387594.1 sugar ABC transporter substrate-binding protein [Bariatricus massiliensis]MCB7411755.1 sugar ABC transporter substrate-binding protein [Bariatricus massiliensis]MCQ5253891.1 sugar ABC transporter substrate-binding protein [Bariatricus
MKKRLLSILLCAALTGILVAGCGAKKNDDTNKEDKTTETKEITVMVPDWAVPSDDMLADFTEDTGIEVVMNVVGWDDIRDKVAIAASGGAAAADVIEVDWSWVGEMNSAGWLEEIEMSDEDKADMPTLETFTIDGKVLAVPYANDYRIAYYNKEHFKAAGIEKAPETWDEVYDALKKIKEAGIVEYPYTMPMNADESATTSMMWMAFSRSGQVFNEDGTLNEEAVVDALEFEKKLVDEGYTDPAIKTASGMDCYRKITAGEASFMVGPTKFVGLSNNKEECSVVGQIEAILLPGKEGTSDKTMPLPEAVGVTKFSKNKEAAKEFVKWYTSADTQKDLFKANSSIPTRNEVLAELIEDGTIENAGAMLDEAKLIKSPFPQGIPAYYSEMSNAIYNNINKMVLGEVSAQEAFDAMNKKVTELTSE